MHLKNITRTEKYKKEKKQNKQNKKTEGQSIKE